MHIEADSRRNAAQIPDEDPPTGAPLTDYTFYGRYLPSPSDGRDNGRALERLPRLERTGQRCG